MPTRTFPGQYQYLAEIGDFVTQIAKEAGFDSDQVYAVQLAVDEACANIIEHGYGGEGRGDILCSCDSTDEGITIVIKDWGQRFAPDEVPEPDYDVPLEKLQSRGAGLFLMSKLMDDVDFEFGDSDGNTLIMTKRK
ncbi:MAG: ATP-binding protein [Anaerolineales bacterium]|nr:ATP-binding protein [Anaerolineales bacterium]